MRRKSEVHKLNQAKWAWSNLDRVVGQTSI